MPDFLIQKIKMYYSLDIKHLFPSKNTLMIKEPQISLHFFKLWEVYFPSFPLVIKKEKL